MSDDDVTLEPEDGEGATETLAEKLKDLREKLKKTEKERAEYLEGWQRAKADYVNAKKRAEEGRQDDIKFASQNLLLNILPALDSFEAALAHLEPNSEIATGFKNTYTQLLKVLEENGLTSFNPEGAAFDPNLHEPMDTLAVKKESEDNIVTKVHQKGYTLHGKIIRPARVQVAHFTKP